MDVRNENELKPNTWHTHLVPFDLILRAFRIFKDCLFYLKPLCFIPLFVLKLLEIIKCCRRVQNSFPSCKVCVIKQFFLHAKVCVVLAFSVPPGFCTGCFYPALPLVNVSKRLVQSGRVTLAALWKHESRTEKVNYCRPLILLDFEFLFHHLNFKGQVPPVVN